MGNLLLDTNSFHELCNNANIERLLLDFLSAINLANQNSDKTFIERKIDIEQYCFGNYWIDFVYAKWQDFKTNPQLTSISQTTHQLLTTALMKNPTGGTSIDNVQAFTKNYATTQYGFLGVKYNTATVPYLYNKDSYYNWHINYYRNNNNEIKWTMTEEHNLPNIQYSNVYLASLFNTRTDLTKQEEIDKNAKLFCDSFDKNGWGRSTKRAKAYEIGREIARRNYFTENRELSSQESKKNHGDERLIFEIERNGNKLYMSIDFHKCFCYELCDHTGAHLGEFRFDGLRNGPAQISHNLKSI